MSVYIFGIEMPIFEHQSWDIRHGTDGKWYVTDINAETSDGEWHEIIPVPPHGRLKDADALLQRAISHGWSTPKWVSDIVIDDAPTIIPADKEGD